MHIPDGYLSPATAAVMYVASVPFWYRASQKIKALIAGRTVPLIALFAALSFVIMMFNVPLPGGTTGHAVGAALAAIVLGPWAAVLAVSVALIIQAFFFGDGGILAIGANVYNMAIAMPFVAFYLYRWISGNAAITSSRRVVAAAIAGAVEAFVTGLVIAWMQKTSPELLEKFSGAVASATTTRVPRWAWGGLVALIVLTPIGLLAPGTAWGEWGREELEQLGLGYISTGFDRWSSFWSSPIPDYDIPALNNPTIAYIISAVVGVALVLAAVFAIAWIAQRVLARHATQTT
jgi:cobalt/nickel transport system permease protein